MSRMYVGLVILGEEVGAPACDVDFDLHFAQTVASGHRHPPWSHSRIAVKVPDF